MADMKKEELTRVIDACIEASENLERIEITVRGVRNEIDEISTKLFFHYKSED